ncbi:SpoIIE family protein phosphatase [Lentisphaerota bacterium ZTH]|nr:SpoIIE family protein phosphatase [Lentisphaerota bacterium]WET07685.1 SpoIIE family protein phosphatase [Lentisphaerota bacterium ZTH]
MPKLSIKVKIAVIMIALCGVAFFAAYLLTYVNLRRLGRYTLSTYEKLGRSALDESSKSLVVHSIEELKSLSSGQSAIINVQLKRISDELAVLANLSARCLAPDSTDFKSVKDFVSDKKPANIYDYSIIEDFGVLKRQSSFSPADRKLATLHPLLKFIFGNHENLDQIYVSLSSGSTVSFPWRKTPHGYNPHTRPWYTAAIKADGKAVWVGPYVSASFNQLVITCSKAIKNEYGKIVAVAALDMDVEKLTNEFLKRQLSRESTAFIIDSEGNILARKGMESSGLNWQQEYKKENLFNTNIKALKKVAVKMIGGESGIHNINLPGEPSLYIAYSPIPEAEWSFAVVIRTATLMEAAQKTDLMIKQNVLDHSNYIRKFLHRNSIDYLILAIAAVCGILASSMILSHKITSPIMLLKQKAQDIGKGNFKSKIHLKTGDELERLDNTFDNMTREIQTYMRDIAASVSEREKMEQEMMVAADIQQAMLPEDIDENDRFTLKSFMKPAKEVGGDFYNFFMVDKDHLFFCIGDVSGKGMAASMFMAQATTLVGHEGRTGKTPDKMLHSLNIALSKKNDTCMFATVFCGILDLNTGVVTFSNAGHTPPIFLKRGTARLLQLNNGIAVGPYPVPAQTFKQEKVKLDPGDSLLLYTDGITEANNPEGSFLGLEGLLRIFSNRTTKHLKPIMRLLNGLDNFCQQEVQTDDITMVAITYIGKEKHS